MLKMSNSLVTKKFAKKTDEYQTMIEFRPYEYDNTTLLIHHDVCLNLENVFIQSTVKDNKIYFSKKATYSPSDCLQVCSKTVYSFRLKTKTIPRSLVLQFVSITQKKESIFLSKMTAG